MEQSLKVPSPGLVVTLTSRKMNPTDSTFDGVVSLIGLGLVSAQLWRAVYVLNCFLWFKNKVGIVTISKLCVSEGPTRIS